MEKQKVVYEWVFEMNKGEEIILTENQFEFYKSAIENEDTRQIIFSDIVLNPVFVVSAFKRPALIIKKKYPCRQCGTVGYNEDKTDWCPRCGGSGVDLPVKT